MQAATIVSVGRSESVFPIDQSLLTNDVVLLEPQWFSKSLY